MRVLSYILIAVGILLLLRAGYDELHGRTLAPSGGSSRYSFLSSSHEILTRTSKPEDFHNAMTYHWFYASMLLIAGFVANMIDRSQEKCDPLSPDFAGNKALDEWGDAMKNEEKEKRQSIQSRESQ